MSVMMFATLTTDACRQAISDGIDAALSRVSDHVRGKVESCLLYANGVQTSSRLFAVLSAANLDKATRSLFLDAIEAGLDDEQKAALREVERFLFFAMNNTGACLDALERADAEEATFGAASFQAATLFGGDWWQWLCAVLQDDEWPESEYDDDELREGGLAAIEIITALPQYQSYRSGYERA